MRNRTVRAFAVVSLAAALIGRHGSRAERGPRRRHHRTPSSRSASFDFAESRLLAEIYSQALDRAGLPVRRAFGLGPRELVAPALREGLVDVVPEYAGTAVQFLSIGRAHPEADVDGHPCRARPGARGNRRPCPRARAGPGRQRLRGPSGGRGAARARHG